MEIEEREITGGFLTGYWSTLHLINVKIKKESIPIVNQTLNNQIDIGLSSKSCFLERVIIDRDGFLSFKASEDGSDPYVPYDDGTTPALNAKWYEDETIAEWLKQHSEQGGRIVLHSLEADGEAWGWEFDGKGRMRELQLHEVGEWK